MWDIHKGCHGNQRWHEKKRELMQCWEFKIKKKVFIRDVMGIKDDIQQSQREREKWRSAGSIVQTCKMTTGMSNHKKNEDSWWLSHIPLKKLLSTHTHAYAHTHARTNKLGHTHYQHTISFSLSRSCLLHRSLSVSKCTEIVNPDRPIVSGLEVCVPVCGFIVTGKKYVSSCTWHPVPPAAFLEKVARQVAVIIQIPCLPELLWMILFLTFFIDEFFVELVPLFFCYIR